MTIDATGKLRVVTESNVYHVGVADETGVRTVSSEKSVLPFNQGRIVHIEIGERMAILLKNVVGCHRTSPVVSVENE